jgi:hypothetical protein
MKNAHFSILFIQALGPTQLPSQSVTGFFPRKAEVKRSGREADRSPPTSADVKKKVDLQRAIHNFRDWCFHLVKT